MPKVKDGPKKLNDLLESVYSSCMKKNNDSTMCSKESWSVAKKNGWYKDSKGNWRKRS